jgi:hypothetical protein
MAGSVGLQVGGALLTEQQARGLLAMHPSVMGAVSAIRPVSLRHLATVKPVAR